MPIQTASTNFDQTAAVAELKRQYGSGSPSVVIFFAASRYDLAAIGGEIHKTFPGAVTVGCSTAGELVDDKMLSGSLVAMFLDEDIVETAASTMIEEISGEISIMNAFGALEKQLGAPVSSLDIHKYVGLVIADGLSGAEERLMEKLGDRTNLFFVGGSAGDDLQFAKTYVFADGKAASNAAVLVVLKLKKDFEIVKTQSFKPMGKTLTATRVDEARRLVLEFNHKPALDAYAEALGVPVEQAAALFFQHPLGLMVGDEPYVRSPQRADGKSMYFYCQILDGMELELLTSTDLIAETRAVIEAKKQALGKIGGLLHFQCILRTLQLRNADQCDLYSKVFAGIPTAGFSTYGEAYLGHINQTSTMLLFH